MIALVAGATILIIGCSSDSVREESDISKYLTIKNPEVRRCLSASPERGPDDVIRCYRVAGQPLQNCSKKVIQESALPAEDERPRLVITGGDRPCIGDSR